MNGQGHAKNHGLLDFGVFHFRSQIILIPSMCNSAPLR